MTLAQARRLGLVADVRAITLRGEWPLMDMLNNQSIMSTLTMYNRLKK